MMQQFEICLEDLTKEAQERLTKLIDVKEINPFMPIATVDFETFDYEIS